jgi:hypothetical protein
VTRPAAPGRLAYWMRALGRHDMPVTLEISSRRLRHIATAKHDFWAATGFYEDDVGGRVVMKMYRTARFAGVPLRWLGCWQCRREVRFYRRLAGLPCVPALLETVGETAYARAFVPGHPLSRQRAVPEGFWPRLDTAIREVHRRGVAYVDANKPENVLVGDDGRPYLIDFQIAWGGRARPRGFGRWWLDRLQREDLYHLLKHKRRFGPHLMTPEELARVRQRSLLIRAHRVLNRPYLVVRRRLFRWLRRSRRILPSGSN